MNIFKKIYCRIFQGCFHIAIPFLPYRNPKILHSIEELPAEFASNGIKKVFLVTDSVLRSVAENLIQMLPASGIECVVYDKTKPNPTVSNVEDALSIYLAEKCDALIAFGGGSTIDCAKAVGIRVANPHKTLAQMKGILKVRHKLPLLAAVPTTAGTGSETTVSTIVTDDKTHYKYPISDFPLIPHIAVLDPKVTFTMPASLTATTGMDALVHAIEAFIGGSTVKLSRAYATKAVQLILANIEQAYNHGNDETARKNMLVAANLAGSAFSRSYVGYVHAVAHSLGGAYNTPHGLANSVLLPVVLKRYGRKIWKKLKILAVAGGIADETDSAQAATEKFIAGIYRLNEAMGIPKTLKEIKAEDIPELARRADKEANPIYPVPILWNAKELEQFYFDVMDKQFDKTSEGICALVEKQRRYFASGATLPLSARISALKKLYAKIKEHEPEITEALNADLGKSRLEGFMCETGLVLGEISYMLKHIRKFAKDEKKHTPITNFASNSFVRKSPYGNVLVMSPWNYPFLLTIEPLIDAITAGNTVLAKPSAYSPNTSKIIEKLISESFVPEHAAVVTGGRAENQSLLEQKFDYIFFTGSQNVGREVMRKAAEHLTPVTLELGGKSPCVVDKTANIPLAAKRIVWGKYLNCGQTCVAPDYILCHESVKDILILELKKQIEAQFGKAPLANSAYGKIINQKHYDRICSLIDKNKVVYGGATDAATLRIEPTIMDNVTWEDAIMGQEIFGPVLPILTYKTEDEIFSTIKNHSKPLALYVFTCDKKLAKKVTLECAFGGGCINDTIIHLATHNLGFGGVGESGMGTYHGKLGFDTFTHAKSIVEKKNWIDLPMRYQPFSRLKESILRMFFK